MQERMKRLYSLPPDVVNLIDQVHLIDGTQKSDIVADSVRTVCLIRLAVPSVLRSLDSIEADLKAKKR